MSFKSTISITVVLAVAMCGCGGDDPVAPSSESDLTTVAMATRTEVRGTGEGTGLISIGRMFVTAGVTHVRGNLNSWAFSGDITGTGEFELNANFNEAGHGNFWAPFYIDAEWEGRTGTFTGNAAGRIHGYWISSTFTAHGTGELEGLKWIGTYEGAMGFPFVYGGHIVEP